jgi:transcriptional regulator with XRE-family HTH domain
MAEPDFARNLRRMISERGMTASTVAYKSGLCPATVYNYLRGTRTPTVDALRKMRATLGCTWDELLGD